VVHGGCTRHALGRFFLQVMPMEGIYRKIYTRIWHDEVFKELSTDARLLFLYFLVCPHGHLAGIFVLPFGYAVEDLDWEYDRIRKAWQEVESKELILYDPGSKVILIPNFLKYNPFENRNTVTSAIRHVSSLPNSRLIGSWCEMAKMNLRGKMSELVPGMIGEFEVIFSERFGELFAEPSGETGTGTGTGTEAGTEAGEKPNVPNGGGGNGAGVKKTDWTKSVKWNPVEGCFEGITPEMIGKWKGAYPAVDFEVQLCRADEWLKSNPTKGKKNYYRFLTNWFSRSQERGGR